MAPLLEDWVLLDEDKMRHWKGFEGLRQSLMTKTVQGEMKGW